MYHPTKESLHELLAHIVAHVAEEHAAVAGLGYFYALGDGHLGFFFRSSPRPSEYFCSGLKTCATTHALMSDQRRGA